MHTLECCHSGVVNLALLDFTQTLVKMRQEIVIRSKTKGCYKLIAVFRMGHVHYLECYHSGSGFGQGVDPGRGKLRLWRGFSFDEILLQTKCLNGHINILTYC